MAMRLGRIHSAALTTLLVATVTALSVASVPAPSPGELVDARTGGNPYFFFLPPVARLPPINGVFASFAQPVVEICQWTGTACKGSLVARFWRDAALPSDRIRVDLEDEAFVLNWHTGRSAVNPNATYRISVVGPGGLEFGHLDLFLEAPASYPRAPSQRSNSRLVARHGSTVPIRFRLEEGALLASRNVEPQLDALAAATLNITQEGGQIEAWREGVRYTLTVPQDAVETPTEIVLTPLAALDGLAAAGGLIAGVSLTPEGLALYRAATLTIELPTPVSPPRAVSFAYGANGESFHLVPSTITPSQITLSIAHFSGAGAKASSSADCAKFNGVTTEPVAREAFACVLTGAGNDLDNLSAGDHGVITAILQDWFEDTVLTELLNAGQLDALSVAYSKLLTWQADVDLAAIIGCDVTLLRSLAEVAHDAFVSSLQSIADSLVAACVAEESPQAKTEMLNQLLRIRTIAEQLALDIGDPASLCGGDLGTYAGAVSWMGTGLGIFPAAVCPGGVQIPMETCSYSAVLGGNAIVSVTEPGHGSFNVTGVLSETLTAGSSRCTPSWSAPFSIAIPLTIHDVSFTGALDDMAVAGLVSPQDAQGTFTWESDRITLHPVCNCEPCQSEFVWTMSGGINLSRAR